MSTDDTAKKILRHMRKNQARLVTWKELANVASARPEVVKDAMALLTRECHPITVSGAGCVYANSKVRRSAAKKEVAVSEGEVNNKRDLLSELVTLREHLFAQAGAVETLIDRLKRGEVPLPARRDAAAEGAALRSIRLERGASVAAMAGWMGKTTTQLEALERGDSVLSDAEIAVVAKELRMDASVLAKRLRGDKPPGEEGRGR